MFSNDYIELETYKDIDAIRVNAAQLKLQFLLDRIEPNKVIFDDFNAEENSLISALGYRNNGICAICNKRYSTAVKRRDDNGLRFNDATDGHCSAIHGMLRLLFAINRPVDTILGHAHNLFTIILYSLIIRSFNRDYALTTFPEENLAAIRYACACISAYKHFELDSNANDVSVPLTTLIFNRVNPNYYISIYNPINTYDAFVSYIEDRGNIKNIDKTTVINKILGSLGYRALITLECGIDMLIDCILSKSINHIISHNLFKIIGLKNYDSLQSKIFAVYSQQLDKGIMPPNG